VSAGRVPSLVLTKALSFPLHRIPGWPRRPSVWPPHRLLHTASELTTGRFPDLAADPRELSVDTDTLMRSLARLPVTWQ
jgi:hypothetical protein